MLTGYNTDINFEGVTYHVQTEDKGLKNPIILSLIYQKGTILGAKRTNYQDLITDNDVDEVRLSKAMERQHQIILAAIQGGKLEQLIQRLNADTPAAKEKAAAAEAAKEKVESQSAQETPVITAKAAHSASGGLAPVSQPVEIPAAPAAPVSKPSSSSSSRIYSLSDLTSDNLFSLDELLNEFLKSDRPRETLGIEMPNRPKLVAGEDVLIRATVLYDGQWPAVNAAVKIQVLGTTFKPHTYTLKCDQSGNFSQTVTLPEFTAGTAAMIIQATEPRGEKAEIKMLIRKR